jgi:hypothetical protein
MMGDIPMMLVFFFVQMLPGLLLYCGRNTMMKGMKETTQGAGKAYYGVQ